MSIPQEQITRLIDLALAEDIASGDITTLLLIPETTAAEAALQSKAQGILAGIDVFSLAFLRIDPGVKIEILLKDGSSLHQGNIIARVRGSARSILQAERVALNFLQRLSAIATRTGQFVAQVQDLPVQILDTRKTTPGLRLLEKYAVKTGGGQNHRLNLSDGVLIKDNHLQLCRKLGFSLGEAVRKAKTESRAGIKIEVETTSLEEVEEAIVAGADIIMFDNMNPATMRRAVAMLPAGIKCEASGGITLENVRAIAETGVHYISIGGLTHSAPALDISLDFI